MGKQEQGLDERSVYEAIADHFTDVSLVIGDDSTVLWRHLSPDQSLMGPVPEPNETTEVVGTRLVDRIHPDDLPVVLAAVEQLRAGQIERFSMPCRVFDIADETLLYDADVRGIDARDVDGIGGLLVMATVVDARRTHADQVHGDDFSLADASPVGLALVASDGRIVYANTVSRTQLGLGDGTTLTVSDVDGLDDLVGEARLRGSAEQTLTRDALTLRAVARTVPGGIGHIVISTDDITAEMEAVEARVRSEQTLRATFEHTPAGIALVDIDGRAIEINRAWTAITGHAAHDLVGHSFDDITHPSDVDIDRPDRERLLAGDDDTYRVEKRFCHRDGQIIWVDLWVSLVRDAAREPVHFVFQILDITEAKQAEAEMLAREEQLTHDATHDHLTGLPNRALIEEHLRVAIARGDRRDGATVLAIDLDGFKPVNDRYGHAVGDAVLEELAGRMRAACRSGDIVGRMGGDEFIAIADPVGDDGERLGARLLAAVSQPLESTPDPVAVTASIGVTRIDWDDTLESLLARADEACYAAKREGGNRIVSGDWAAS